MTQDYYGCKRVTAWPEDRGTDAEGYAVKYADGYVSWSPKEAFEAAYKPITAMGFEGALAAMKAGLKVRRAGWHEEGDPDHYLRMSGSVIVYVFDPKEPNVDTLWDDVAIHSDDLLETDWMIVE